MNALPALVRTEEPELPESDAEIIKETILFELGEVVFQQLCEALGGQEISIPKHAGKITEGHYLAQAIGLENARIMTESVGVARYYVPLFRNPPNDPDARLLGLVRRGCANWEIARAMGHSERHVRRRLSALGVSNPNRKPRKLFPLPGFHGGGAVAAGGAA